ncbi:MAG: DUF1844 domain-containing protein [bacterium]|nr:DUF1844 domain-containing protein [bacterium]
MADFDNENKPRTKRDVVIEDMRHRRDVDDTEGQEEEVAQPEPVPTAEDVTTESAAATSVPPSTDQDVVTAESGVTAPQETGTDAAATVTPSDIAEAELGEAVAPSEYSEDEIRAIEREQLRQIISLGLVNYLKYQLTMVLNFALLNLGSAPDPVSGLVTKDLPQAKLAIDVLEFFVARLQGEMSAAERAQMVQLVSDLKYSFMQAASGADIPAAPGSETGEA